MVDGELQMKIVVLGKNGMLGGMVYDYFSRQGYDVVGTDRASLDALGFLCDPQYNQSALNDIDNADYVINCIGVIKPCINESDTKSVANAIMINSIFPRLMADYCKASNTKFIHITTDCVFEHSMDFRSEDSLHNASDVYGKSKSLGEPTNCMVLRTSIIGPEKNNKRSLLEWVLSQPKGSIVSGYSNHIWNGVTTLTLAKVIDEIILSELYSEELYHICGLMVSKDKLLQYISGVYELELCVSSIETEVDCVRWLASDKHLLKDINIIYSHIVEQLEELKAYDFK